ncbi:hypothetical protein MTR67_020313 [Solanum verrucosum]|uniref:Uncharacterized protein n=1 Tax=Solanum verrucosum TaxID=315347 RepID=A0AAF0QRD5_SOLVR|nr:hypothetical protein MTR67_020313 [Solanum verrucosum]
MKLTEPRLKGLERRLIRITLSTKNVKNLEKMCTDLVCGAKDRLFIVVSRCEMLHQQRFLTLSLGSLPMEKAQIHGTSLS